MSRKGTNDKDLRVTRARAGARHAFGFRPDHKQQAYGATTATRGEIELLRVILDEPYSKQVSNRTSSLMGDNGYIQALNTTPKGVR